MIILEDDSRATLHFGQLTSENHHWKNVFVLLSHRHLLQRGDLDGVKFLSKWGRS